MQNIVAGETTLGQVNFNWLSERSKHRTPWGFQDRYNVGENTASQPRAGMKQVIILIGTKCFNVIGLLWCNPSCLSIMLEE